MIRTQKTDEEKILEEAKKRYQLCVDSESHLIKTEEEDIDFVLGNQYSEEDKERRKGRPCLKVNKLPKYINAVVNDARQNRPQGKTRPFEDADKDTSEIITGLIRHISNNSNADAAYSWAIDRAVTMSRGAFRILADYDDPMSFDQEIKFERILNPHSVKFPLHLIKQPDYSDAPYCFVVEDISKQDFEDEFGEIPQDFDKDGSWITEDTVRVAEYFTVEKEEVEIFLLSNGEVVEKDAVLPEGVEIVKSRKTFKRKVMWRKISPFKIHKEKEFPSPWIPIIPVLGKEEIDKNGKKLYISLTRHAKDTQKMYNYWYSLLTERIALAPKPKWVLTNKQVEGFEDNWADANNSDDAYLPYNPDVNAPIPQRTDNISVDTGITNAMMIANQDLEETTGLYKASLGAQGNETSGKAIIARERQGDNATFHFSDNQAIAIKHAVRIIVSMIPTIYDNPRKIRILGDDMQEKIVRINEPYQDENGKEVHYDLTTGKYDVVVDVGPSYATKRIEAAENLLSFVQAVPEAGQVAADIIARNLDFPEAQQLSDRLKALVPPQALQGENKDNAAAQMEAEMQQIVADFQNVVAENDQLKAAMQQAMAELQQAKQQLQDKSADRQLEIDKSMIKSDTDIKKEEMKINADLLKQIISGINNIQTQVDQMRASGNGQVAAPITAMDTEV